MAVEEVVILAVGIQNEHIMRLDIDIEGYIRQMFKADIHREATVVTLRVVDHNIVGDKVVITHLNPATWGIISGIEVVDLNSHRVHRGATIELSFTATTHNIDIDICRTLDIGDNAFKEWLQQRQLHTPHLGTRIVAILRGLIVATDNGIGRSSVGNEDTGTVSLEIPI